MPTSPVDTPTIDTPPGGPETAGGPRALLVGLAVACGVLLLAGIGLGAFVADLVGDRGSVAAPSPAATPSATPSPTPTPALETMASRLPVTDRTDLSLRQLMLATEGGGGRLTGLYAVGTNDTDSTIYTGIDATAFAADGSILSRASSLVLFLPGQTTMFQTIFIAPVEDAVSITVARSSLKRLDAPVTGKVSVAQVGLTEGGSLHAALTANLSSAPAGTTTAYVAGTLDGELVVACWDWPKVPRKGKFSATCQPQLTVRPPAGMTRDQIIETAEYSVFIRFDRTYGK